MELLQVQYFYIYLVLLITPVVLLNMTLLQCEHSCVNKWYHRSAWKIKLFPLPVGWEIKQSFPARILSQASFWYCLSTSILKKNVTKFSILMVLSIFLSHQQHPSFFSHFDMNLFTIWLLWRENFSSCTPVFQDFINRF